MSIEQSNFSRISSLASSSKTQLSTVTTNETIAANAQKSLDTTDLMLAPFLLSSDSDTSVSQSYLPSSIQENTSHLLEVKQVDNPHVSSSEFHAETLSVARFKFGGIRSESAHTALFDAAIHNQTAQGEGVIGHVHPPLVTPASIEAKSHELSQAKMPVTIEQTINTLVFAHQLSLSSAPISAVTLTEKAALSLHPSQPVLQWQMTLPFGNQPVSGIESNQNPIPLSAAHTSSATSEMVLSSTVSSLSVAQNEIKAGSATHNVIHESVLKPLSQGLSERILFQMSTNLKEANIRLDPPELGHVRLNISVDNDKLQVQMQSSTAQTRELLASVSDRLRLDLLQSTQHIEVNVSISDKAHQSHSEREEQQIRQANMSANEIDENTSSTLHHSVANYIAKA